MPVNFKYLPLAPEALSGPAFIEQTEHAFNELGAEIDANTVTAKEALETANNAAQIAETALETAQDTVSTANTALATANTALSNSSTALNTANNAYDTAVNAESVANAANITANTASTIANAANDAATQASAAASSALVVAESANANALNAIEIAASANDMYVIDLTVRDANEAYENPERSYLTNTGNTNFPVAMPCYFNVLSTGNNAAATQQCWNDEQILYRRYATIDNTDPDNLIVTWSAWVELGGGVRIATDAEASAGVLETVAVNPKQLAAASPYYITQYMDFFETAPLTGWMVRDGSVIASASTAAPKLYAALQLPANAGKLKTEAQWQALSSVAGGVGGVPFFVLNTTANTIRLPDTRGDYARCAGSAFLPNVGDWHGDAIPNFKGEIINVGWRGYSNISASGSISIESAANAWSGHVADNGTAMAKITLDPSLVVPTADENRTRAFAMLGCVYVGV